MEMGCDAKVGLAKVDESGDDGYRVWCYVHQLDAVEVKEPAQEVVRRDAEQCSMCVRKMTVSLVPSIENSSPAVSLQPTCTLGLSSLRSASD
jgi:hypothetical protein